MCGIFGYLNFNRSRTKREIAQTLLNGLKRLEYRGYDSAGKFFIHFEQKVCSIIIYNF